MDDPPVDTRKRLGWGLRHYFVALLIPMVLAPLGAVAFARGSQGEYRAMALVVAKTLTLKQEQLPHFGEVVFTSGAVAKAVANDLNITTPPERLIPKSISVAPIPDTVLFRVLGTARDPGESARLANSAAIAFVKELNKAGAGVGVFALQDSARRPDAPVSSTLGPATLAVLGLLVGLVFGIGLIAVVVSVRRPVVSAAEVAAFASVPVVSVVIVHHSPSARTAHASLAGGVSRLARTLFPTGTEQCAVVASAKCHRAASEVALRLAERIGTRLVQATGAAPTDRPLVLMGPEIDSTFDLPPSVLAADRRLLVLTEGTPEKDVRQAVSQFGPEELDGIALVSTRAVHRPQK